MHISPHIEIVTPSIYFDTVLKKRGYTSLPAKKIGLPGVGHIPKTSGKIKTLFKDLKDCDKMITPLCLRALYGFFYHPSASDRNTFGIGGPYLLSVNHNDDFLNFYRDSAIHPSSLSSI